MNTHLDALSGGRFHSTGNEAAAVPGGAAVAAGARGVGSGLIAGKGIRPRGRSGARSRALRTEGRLSGRRTGWGAAR